MAKKFRKFALKGVNRNKYHSSSCIHKSTCRRPSSGFFANRFRSAACQKIQLPPGGSQEEVAGANSIQCTHPFRERWVAKSPCHLQIVYSRNRRAEELSGIANTADLLYTYFKGNLCPVQGPSDSGVSQAYHFIECHHQHPAGGDDGSKQWGGIPLLHYRCQSYT